MKLSDFVLSDELEEMAAPTPVAPPVREESRPAASPPLAPSETETALLSIWQEVLGTAACGPDDNFFELGGHSLHALKLTHLVHLRLGVEVPFTMLYDAPTVRRLAPCLLDAVRFGRAEIDQPLVVLGAGAEGRPLFAFPPGTADALGYAPLAEGLPGFAFHAFNFPECDDPAGRYADLMIEARPRGPYLLFGYSGGGNLAFRAARELERRGCRVSAVVMLDSSRFFERFAFPPDEPRRLAEEFLRAEEVEAIVTSPLLREKVVRNIQRYYDYLAAAPEVEPVDAAIHVVASEGAPDRYHDETGRLVCSKSGWAELARGGFQLHAGHGGHGQMLLRPFREANTALLRGIFDSIGVSGEVFP